MLALEGVAPDDRAEAAAVADGADLVHHRRRLLRLAAREDDDAAAGEGALHDMLHALGQRADGNLLLLVDLLGSVLLDVRRGQLHLDDVGAELRGDLRRVGDHVDGGLALLRDAGTARIRPHHDRQALALRLLSEVAQLLVHHVAQRGGGVDREADGDAAEPERLVDATRERGARLALRQRVRVVQLEDEGDVAGELRRPGLEEAERRGVGVAARADAELEVVARIVARGVGRERARRPVLEPLVHGENDHPAATAEAAVVQHAGQVGERAGVVAPVPAQDLAHSLLHADRPSVVRVIRSRPLAPPAAATAAVWTAAVLPLQPDGVADPLQLRLSHPAQEVWVEFVVAVHAAPALVGSDANKHLPLAARAMPDRKLAVKGRARHRRRLRRRILSKSAAHAASPPAAGSPRAVSSSIMWLRWVAGQ